MLLFFHPIIIPGPAAVILNGLLHLQQLALYVGDSFRLYLGSSVVFISRHVLKCLLPVFPDPGSFHLLRSFSGELLALRPSPLGCVSDLGLPTIFLI
jgi:hypothetical protein